MASPTATSPATVLPVATTTPGVLLKMDTRGRVRTSPERRQAILAEFDRSGVSAAQFAQLAGLRYSTFAGWVSRHRRAKSGSRKTTSAGAASRRTPLRLVEAVVAPAATSPSPAGSGLLVHLPGGVRLELTAPAQVPLAIALLHGLQPPATRC